MNSKILKISVGDIVEMKKNHPCGGKLFHVMRVGSDIRIVCEKCGRDLTIDRIKFEKSVNTLTHKTEDPKGENNLG